MDLDQISAGVMLINVILSALLILFCSRTFRYFLGTRLCWRSIVLSRVKPCFFRSPNISQLLDLLNGFEVFQVA